MTVTTHRKRRLDWDGAWNARDLGGYPTRNGGETRWGSIARSDDPASLTDAGREALLQHGIQCIVDLRMPSELLASPHPFADGTDHGIVYKNISFIDPARSKPIPELSDLVDDYISMIDLFASRVAEVMNAVAEAPDGPILIHCMAGKDRTGLISALLLDLAGVPRETIAADYALTAEYGRERDAEWLEHGPGDRADRQAQLEKFKPTDEVMLTVLDHLDSTHGGVEPYLCASGVSADNIARLRSRLLESPDMSGTSTAASSNSLT